MQTISKLSKIFVILFSIACTIVFLQDRLPIFPINYSPFKLSDEIAYVYQKVMTTSEHIKHIPITTLNNNEQVQIVPQNSELNSLIDSPMNPSTSIWSNIGKNLDLDHYSKNPRVQAEMKHILANKKDFEAILNRSAPFIYYIYKQTQARHLPAEIALIPIIESNYNPNNANSIGATGLWQFMPGTARGFGLKVGDGARHNIIDSTNAALKYYSDLGKEFKGNWNLAFAAYNCGDGCVSGAVKRANSTNFFNLNLPLETKVYVPRLLAMAVLIKHANEYGITLPQIKDAPYFAQVKVNKSESLSNYAKSTGTNLKVLKELNPGYRFQKANSLSSTLLVPVNSQST